MKLLEQPVDRTRRKVAGHFRQLQRMRFVDYAGWFASIIRAAAAPAWRYVQPFCQPI
ncbi:hypothetical protein M3O57_16570 [Xanthomonas nasturtii]|uniref:Transposase n=1 Tax=Xanthomonas nasturtii TaxID=1843581 RepID=A0ABT0LVB7_9XANT|nr:hypothetical protein [Xanthomonas nasturtii]MCL1501480.1 hypothetical protein [Xanthomonas nasturtii]MCL1505394.1 hypothetical protein [Xanthomonas nasturtii]MCL1524892.1 hypothetical protein [Xanthomonas nasturtii]MCL1532623.1 hypothetical protein [Xanthomonas nasturtii]MCL1552743.1 hypothetical protein [Xanthomonas nasturtii]